MWGRPCVDVSGGLLLLGCVSCCAWRLTPVGLLEDVSPVLQFQYLAVIDTCQGLMTVALKSLVTTGNRASRPIRAIRPESQERQRGSHGGVSRLSHSTV